MLKARPDIFTALADPVRRQLLAHLHRHGQQTLGQLAAPLPISRQAVTKHLNLLISARLVTVNWRGRERWHQLQPLALKAAADWLQPYAQSWDSALSRLRQHLGETGTSEPQPEQHSTLLPTPNTTTSDADYPAHSDRLPNS